MLNLDEKSTLYKYVLPVKLEFLVPSEGWINLLLINCDQSSSGMKIHGEVTFHNPYGMIPGELYGLLPFEVKIIFSFLIHDNSASSV